MTQIQRMDGGRSIARPSVDNSDIVMLDPHTGIVRPAGSRVDDIATISLGYKDDRGVPRPSRLPDAKWLHAHNAEQAPALLAALEHGNHRTLVISLAADAWGDFVQQHLALYSKTKLIVYGDSEQLTHITWQYVLGKDGEPVPVTDKNGEPEVDRDGRPIFQTEPLHRVVMRADDPEMYERMRKQCKVMTSIYFYLAEWEGNDTDGYTPRIVFDGDVGKYRLRTTSQHTLDNLASAVKDVRDHTGGPLMGVPLSLTVKFPEVVGPDGTKRVIPSASFRLRPPYRITGQPLQRMLTSAVQEGQALALPAPRRETLESEEWTDAVDPEVTAPSDALVDVMAEGGRCNAEKYRAAFFALVADTPYEDARERAALIRLWCEYDGRNETDSLRELLERSTNEQAIAFINWIRERVDYREAVAKVDATPSRPPIEPELVPAGEYERLHGSEEAEPAAVVPSIRQRLERQPSGELTNVDTGEIVESAPAKPVEPTPQPAAENSTAEPDDDDFDPSQFWDDPSEPTAKELPGFGDAPGLAPLAKDDPAEALFPTPADTASQAESNEPQSEPKIADGEVIDFEYCVQLHAAAQKIGIEMEPPGKDWKGRELKSYAKTLTDMMNAQAKGGKK